MDADLFTADLSPIKHLDWQPPEAAVADDSSAGYFLDSIEGSLLNISNELEVESQRIHECSICEKKYKNKHHLQRHLKCHSENNNIRCGQCQANFESEEAFSNHTMTLHKTHLCSTCGKSFATKYNLKRHSACHDESVVMKLRECPEPGCDKTFVRKYELEEHTNVYHCAKPFICEKCGREYKTKAVRNRHQRICVDQSKVTCKDCGEVFTREDSFQRHINARHKGKKYYCSCGKEYSYYATLFRHRRKKNHE